MYFTTDTYFLPKNFVVHTFYDEKTCFCWNQNKLVVFPYTSNDHVSVKVLTAPAVIKSVQCFASRIFLICIPQGIYKLSRDLKFAVLSTSAIGMGTIFYKVLTPRAEYLYLDDKRTMINKVLFQLSSKDIDSRKLCVYPLTTDNIDEHFMKALKNDNFAIENLCIIGYGQKILMLMNETVQLIYSSIHSIKDIIPVKKNTRTAALFLLTDTDTIIVMYSKNDTLDFENICLGTQVYAICTGFSQLLEDTLWIVYSCESQLCYARKQLITDNTRQIKVQNKEFVCLQLYNSKIILGLTVDKQLVEFPIESVEKMLSMENDNFIDLHSDMLNGIQLVMDKIYKGTRELHSLNELLTKEENKLKRINLYAHKCKLRFCPRIVVKRIANRIFLSANFCKMPKCSWVVFSVKLEYRNVFYMRKVANEETVIDIDISENVMVDSMQITTDLIVFKEEGYPWCVIKDYVIDPCYAQGVRKKTRSHFNLINSKITMLATLIEEGSVNLKKLSEIKRSVRKELNGVQNNLVV